MLHLNPYESPSFAKEAAPIRLAVPLPSFVRGGVIVTSFFLLTLPAAAITGVAVCLTSQVVLGDWLGWTWSGYDGLGLGAVAGLIALTSLQYGLAWRINCWD